MRTARANHMLFPASARKYIMARHSQVFARNFFDFSDGKLPACLVGKKYSKISIEVVLPIDQSVSPLNPRENTEQPSCISCQSFLTLWPVSMIVNHQARHQELYDVAKEASNGPISVGRLVVSIKYDTFPVLVGHFTRKT